MVSLIKPFPISQLGSLAIRMDIWVYGRHIIKVQIKTLIIVWRSTGMSLSRGSWHQWEELSIRAMIPGLYCWCEKAWWIFRLWFGRKMQRRSWLLACRQYSTSFLYESYTLGRNNNNVHFCYPQIKLIREKCFKIQFCLLC